MAEFDDPLAPLLADYSRSRDNAVRDEIVLSCMDLVDHIAGRYRFTGEPVEDIAQEGYIGLINAVEMFDLSRGVKFTTYASHAVQGAIQHYLRDKGKLIREPGWLHDLNQKINKAVGKLHQQVGREPTVEEIAAELNLPDQQIAEAVRTRDVFRVSSLEQPAGDESEGTFVASDHEKARNTQSQEMFPIVDRLALEEAIDGLRTVERQVVYDFFFGDLSKTEIAAKMGYSISHVSHLLRRALKELKDSLLADERKVMSRQLKSIEGQLAHYVRRVEEETIKDELTGLFNHRYILERLDEEIARSRRYGHQLSICLMQLHGLVEYRAAHGEMEADRVLCIMADILIDASRRIDRIGRYDDQRFILLLPQTGPQATVLCQRVRQRVAELAAAGTVQAESALSATFGIAVFPPSGGDVHSLMQATDVALEAATTDPVHDGVAIHEPPAAG